MQGASWLPGQAPSIRLDLAHQTKQKDMESRWEFKWIFPHVFINRKRCYLPFRQALVETACRQKITAYFLGPNVFSKKGWEEVLMPVQLQMLLGGGEMGLG